MSDSLIHSSISFKNAKYFWNDFTNVSLDSAGTFLLAEQKQSSNIEPKL